VEFGGTGPQGAHAQVSAHPPSGRDLWHGELELGRLRAVEGSHEAEFSAEAREVFWNSEFVVGQQSDRMGVRLAGATVRPPRGGRMVSEGMAAGFVEVAADGGGGGPIVLGPDGPTTGGYPVIAAVAAVDLPVLGQLRPGEKVRFERVSVGEARGLYKRFVGRLDVEVPPA